MLIILNRKEFLDKYSFDYPKGIYKINFINICLGCIDRKNFMSDTIRKIPGWDPEFYGNDKVYEIWHQNLCYHCFDNLLNIITTDPVCIERYGIILANCCETGGLEKIFREGIQGFIRNGKIFYRIEDIKKRKKEIVVEGQRKKQKII